jgi:hypothetical protein
MADETQEYVTAKRARELLGVGVNRMAKLLDENIPEAERVLKWKYSDLDGRIKLVEVASLKALGRREGRVIDLNKLMAAA